MCAGTRLLRKHHIGASASDISVKVTEMFEGVVTSSQVPAVCAPEGNGAFSPLLSPPSLLLFLNLFLCLVVIAFIVVKNLSMVVGFFYCFFLGGGRGFDRVGRCCSQS